MSFDISIAMGIVFALVSIVLFAVVGIKRLNGPSTNAPMGQGVMMASGVFGAFVGFAVFGLSRINSPVIGWSLSVGSGMAIIAALVVWACQPIRK